MVVCRMWAINREMDDEVGKRREGEEADGGRGERRRKGE